MHKHRLIFSGNASGRENNNSPRLILISAFFFVGCVLGAFYGANFSTAVLQKSGLIGPYSGESSFLLDLFRFTWFHILVVFLGTSFLGIAFLPVVTMLKGFVFSCASATIISSGQSGGIIMALATLGIPALFSIPAFFAVSDNAFFRSARLLSLMRGDGSAIMQRGDRRVLVFIPVLLIGLLADMKLVPYIMTLLR